MCGQRAVKGQQQWAWSSSWRGPGSVLLAVAELEMFPSGGHWVGSCFTFGCRYRREGLYRYLKRLELSIDLYFCFQGDLLTVGLSSLLWIEDSNSFFFVINSHCATYRSHLFHCRASVDLVSLPSTLKLSFNGFLYIPLFCILRDTELPL